jgi:hypothetical protein
MVSGVAAIAQRDQVSRVIDATRGTGDQMMDVGFSLGTRVTATPANAPIARENDVSNRAPLKGLRLRRRKRQKFYLGIQAARGADHG